MRTRDLNILAKQLREPTAANLAKLNTLYKTQDMYIEHNLFTSATNVQSEIDILIKEPSKTYQEKENNKWSR